MRPTVRKLALTAHIACSVGMLGSIAAFLVLAVAALVVQDTQLVRSAYLAMNVVARMVIVPLALATLVTGLVQSLGTPWGLFRYYWVTVKFLLTVFAVIILLSKMELVAYAARLAAEAVVPRAELYAAGTELAIHAAGGFLVLLVPIVLSIYKPGGLTAYGRRIQGRPGSHSPPVAAPSRYGRTSRANDSDHRQAGGSITVTIRYAHLLAMVVILLALHLVVVHVAGVGVSSH